MRFNWYQIITFSHLQFSSSPFNFLVVNVTCNVLHRCWLSMRWQEGSDELRLDTNLFGQLFLTQLIESEELSGEDDVILESNGGQFDSDDDLSVGNHHSHSSEVYLQVLGQLLTSRIAWVLPNLPLHQKPYCWYWHESRRACKLPRHGALHSKLHAVHSRVHVECVGVDNISDVVIPSNGLENHSKRINKNTQ